ncbi:MAG: hypothetical protein KJZ47_02205 [Gemmatimonadales bacterium]|nr:hypothetical protein [Gemmatimonadales bacterium]
MPERRYSEAEVAEIFKQATEVQQHARRHLPAGEGMTLADLQAIGQEVGVPAELVARAARSLDAEGPPVTRRFLGLPLGVGRTVELDRWLSEDEWERLVVDLRDTFDARGVVRADGSLRQWTNGNLTVLLEPGVNGHRIRMRTYNEMARALLTGGAGALAATTVVTAMSSLAGALTMRSLVGIGFLAIMGVGLFVAGAMRLSGWSRLRLDQMKGIAARLTLPSPNDPPQLP